MKTISVHELKEILNKRNIEEELVTHVTQHLLASNDVKVVF